ncbi:hypothetical protein NDU88_003816 [Pleurodeles waltl]|uniref:Uncharacterized protein n=1 Tax=Pleurodeles waltl TaxID=8319 RepID=A0AAV7V3G5_PLEWA|nr:hypothetical protein NDU88_003816 [Pleurodeles waltl]
MSPQGALEYDLSESKRHDDVYNLEVVAARGAEEEGEQKQDTAGISKATTKAVFVVMLSGFKMVGRYEPKPLWRKFVSGRMNPKLKAFLKNSKTMRHGSEHSEPSKIVIRKQVKAQARVKG